jgi:pyridoxine 5-phosphate synthase
MTRLLRPAGPLRLGVNIDHVATVRNARGAAWPDPLRAALLAETAGADGITAHLREDRRHIRDGDIEALMAAITIPLNFECAATGEMQSIALRHRPHAVCLVPEKREERTTEGGLDVAFDQSRLADYIAPLREAGCRVSMFISHDARQIEASADIGAAVVELHTGLYSELLADGHAELADRELQALRRGHRWPQVLGLRCMPAMG